jgi:hypothetical protein
MQKLPGAELVEQGMSDIREGRVTVFACLVWIGWPALKRGGIVTEDTNATPQRDAELTMYRLLKGEGGDAFGRYNALLKRLVSFERALVRLEAVSQKADKLKS